MLKNLLSPQECANCKICCCFDSYDLWETPVITHSKASQILQDYLPEQQFITKEDHFILKLKREEDEDLYYCSLLDHSKGCILEEEKPFDCKIWPLRIMSIGGINVIALSPICPVVQTRSISDIMKVCGEISDEIFAEAKEHPEYVKPYRTGYPILAFDESQM